MRTKLRYLVGDQEKSTPIFLFQRKGKTEKGFPAILAMHQMNDYGKDEVAGLYGCKDYAYGHELAAGYVVLAPDYLTFGERVFPASSNLTPCPFMRNTRPGPWWAKISRIRCPIDVLCLSISWIKQERIGHSHGGSNAMFAMAMDVEYPPASATVGCR